MQDDSPDSPYLMTPMEIAWGYVHGHTGTLPPALDKTLTPRKALEQVVREALRRPPCGVAFSGGLDSSTVLAVATNVARREGLPEPVPVTKVFPNAPETHESDWQEMVVRHLGLKDWEKLVLDDELDLVGPLAQRHLLEHGVVWPPTIHGDQPVLRVLQGGSLIDGEGGDEVLGVTAHRILPVTHLVRVRQPMRWRRVRLALGALAPIRVRSKSARERWNEESIPWIRPAAREALIAATSALERTQPLSFAASVRMVPRRRSQVLLASARRFFAEPHDVAMSSPLLHPEFVHALARDGGLLGRGDRAMTLRALIPDLLPDAVLARGDKALFGGAFWSRHAQRFTDRWTGDGVDPELIYPERLAALWRSGEPNALTAALLQQAWLAGQSAPR